MASNNYIYKMSNAGGMATVTRYTDMLAGNTTWVPWEPEGAYDSLAAVTLSAATSSITFAGIPSTYKHLQIRFIGISSASNPDINLTYNGDTGSNYRIHILRGFGGGTAQGESYAVSAITAFVSSVFVAGVTDILDYASTTKTKVARTLVGYDLNGGGAVGLWSHLWTGTSTINSITLTASTGNINQHSQFTLYGVK